MMPASYECIELWNSHVNLTAQVDGTVKAGDPIKARILDVNKKDGVVDLSLRPLHTAAGSKKAAKALSLIEVHKTTIAAAVLHSATMLCNLQSDLPTHPLAARRKSIMRKQLHCFSRSCHGRCSPPVAPTYASKNIGP